MGKNTLYKYFTKIKSAGLAVSATALYITVLLITLDVFTRNFTSIYIVGIYEVVQNYFMPLIAFPALGFVYSTGVMPRLVMVTDRLSPSLKRIVSIIVLVSELILFSALTYFVLTHAVKGTMDRLSFTVGVDRLPIYPALYLPAIGFALMIIEDLFALFEKIKWNADSFSVSKQ